MKSGFVGIIGRANAGKSTLLNALINEKVSIVSAKAQTTRNAIIGVYDDDDSQIIFCDTPGIHESKNKLGNFMNKEAYNQVGNVDIIYYLYDVTKRYSDKDEKILNNLFNNHDNIFLILTKIDLVSKKELLDKITELSQKQSFKEIIPISSIKNNNLNRLIDITKKYLIEDIKYFDSKTNVSLNFRISELIREKILNNFHQEIPYMVTILVENIRYTEAKAFISVVIIVGKENHKSMIIGKGGESLKRINYESSKDIKVLLKRKVNLDIYVKVDEDWFNKENKLIQYGFDFKMQDE